MNAVILAGGQSKRMGRDKAAIEIDGVSLIEHQLDKLRLFLGADTDLFISVQNEADLSALEGAEKVPDFESGQGPMMGVYSALCRMKKGHLLALGVDLPSVDVALLTRIQDNAEPGKGVIPVHPNSGYFEPLVAIYPIEAKQSISDYLGEGKRSFQNWLNQAIDSKIMKPMEIEKGMRRKFVNLNTPEDLVEFNSNRS
jgi:molybdopterin-guanine dinucleotide biosynthesis protein A